MVLSGKFDCRQGKVREMSGNFVLSSLYEPCFNLLIFFFKKLFQEYHHSRVSNKLDSDQTRHFVGSDLGPNCLQRLLASRERDVISGQCSLDTKFKIFLAFQPFLDKSEETCQWVH